MMYSQDFDYADNPMFDDEAVDKKAFIFSIVGFVLGILAILGNICFWGSLILYKRGVFSPTINIQAEAIFFTITGYVCLFFMFVGPVSALVFGILAITVSRDSLQFKRKSVRCLGIVDIILTGVSVVVFLVLVIVLLFSFETMFG